MAHRSIPQPTRTAIAAAYLRGIPSQIVAKDFGVANSSVLAICRQEGVPIHQDRGGRGVRRYHLDESYFDTIDDEAKAYWLGFLAADGAVVGSTVRLNLSAQDIQHLQKFKVALHSDYPVRWVKVKQTSYPYFEVRSARLVRALAPYHIIQGKTFTVRPPELQTDLWKHYWRGYFDGDGCITTVKRRQHWAASIVLNQAMAFGFWQWARDCGFPLTKPRPHARPRLWIVGAGGNRKTPAFLHLLYDGSSVFLDRKHELYKQVLCGPPDSRGAVQDG